MQFFLMTSVAVEILLASLFFNFDIVPIAIIVSFLVVVHASLNILIRFTNKIQIFTSSKISRTRLLVLGIHLSVCIIWIGYFHALNSTFTDTLTPLFVLTHLAAYVVWGIFLIGLPGIAIFLFLSKNETETAAINSFLSLTLGLLFMGFISWILLEITTNVEYYQGIAIPAFNPITLSIIPILSAFYIWRRRHSPILNKVLHLSLADFCITIIVFAMVVMLSFRYIASSPLSLPWFDA